MSTRCQVRIKSVGLAWDEDAIILYHHTDGYASYMLPLILKAYKMAVKPDVYKRPNGMKCRVEQAWRAGRVGKAASFLCASDPGVFEPEANASLHCDIEYFYDITLHNTDGGSCTSKPKWFVQVSQPTFEFGGNPAIENLSPIAEGEISQLAKRAKTIGKD